MKKAINNMEMQSIQNLLYAVTKVCADDIREYQIFISMYGTEFGKDVVKRHKYTELRDNFIESKNWLLSSEFGTMIFEKLINESIDEAKMRLLNKNQEQQDFVA